MNIKDLSKLLEQSNGEEEVISTLKDDSLVSNIEFWEVSDLILKMSDIAKKQILYDRELCEKLKIKDFNYNKIISTMSTEMLAQILEDTDLVKNTLGLSESWVCDLIKSLEDDGTKERLMQSYEISDRYQIELISTFGTKKKTGLILHNEEFSESDIAEILKTFKPEELRNFLEKNKKFCNNKEIYPYSIVSKLESKEQIEFVKLLLDMDINLMEKKEILAILNDDVKAEIDANEFPDELKKALSMKKKYSSQIFLDLERDLEDYRGLDRLIEVIPNEYTEAEKEKFMKLCEICPDITVGSLLYGRSTYFSSGREYLEAEKWISSVIDSLDSTYSKAQKMAVIDNAIGKRISYSPDFDTEVFNKHDSRALWRIISSGYGVCNGIANVEKYIFDRVGIDSEIVSGEAHAFLKIKDIELPLANGEMVRGNTILDPTWNLANNRFGCRPANFCIDYEKAREGDINSEGIDSEAHKNDEQLQDATLKLEDKSLRALFTSVGLADKEGQFPAKDLVKKSNAIHELYANNPAKNVEAQFLLLAEKCPEFISCQNESMQMLSNILLNNENLKFNKCVVDRVYDKTDENRRPFMYVYIDSDELGRKFYLADKEQGKFIESPEEKFTERFECYDRDLERTKGVRPWEAEEQKKETQDLSKSSEAMDIKEEEER